MLWSVTGVLYREASFCSSGEMPKYYHPTLRYFFKSPIVHFHNEKQYSSFLSVCLPPFYVPRVAAKVKGSVNYELCNTFVIEVSVFVAFDVPRVSAKK